MQSLNIVNLIESNPITKLTNAYNNKFLLKIKENFTEMEQQLFVSSCYCYLNYNQTTDFVIDLDNIWKWLGFSKKQTAKILLENQFNNNVDYKMMLSQLAEQTNDEVLPTLKLRQKTGSGGHNKETILLTVKAFKLFCIKAGTKKATEIHEYFIKLEDTLHQIIQEESNELKLQLEQQKDELQTIAIKTKIEYDAKLVNEKVLEREKILLKQYGSIGSIVYIIKVKTFENGQYIVKIGESRKGITNRYNEHKSKYDECLLLDCFLVQKSNDFENFIHNYDTIRLNRVTDLSKHETELELFLIGKNLSYQMLSNVINHNIKYFNNDDTTKLELENEQLKLLIEMNKSNNNDGSNKELINIVKQLSNKIDNLEKINIDLLHKLNATQTKVVTGFNNPLVTLGPRVQKIHPETLLLIKVYESVSELIKEDNNIKRPSINKAVVENTVYNGFRWLLVDRELDPSIITHIGGTKQTKEQHLGYIAKLNVSKTEIINVYLDRKSASQLNGFESSSALDNPVKKMTIAKGHYYMLYDECEEDIRNNFNKLTNGKPMLYKNGVGQYDLQNNLIREFLCKYDCIKTLSMSDKTLTKALTQNIQYNGYYFKEIGSKLKCF